MGLTFGASSHGFILNNYSTLDPLATVARLAVSASVICTFPLAFTGLRDGVMSLSGLPSTNMAFRSTILALLAAITALALAIHNVAFVVNLGGAIFGALLTYIFPSLLLLRKCCLRASSVEARFAWVTIGGGVLLGALGSV